MPVATTASSQETALTNPSNAADRNINTRWASALGAGPQYVQLDFGAPQAIARVLLTWEAAYAQQYLVQISSDGYTWTTLQTITSGDGGADDLTGLSGYGRYLRITGTVRGTSYGYSLYEVETFGPAAPLATGPAAPTVPALGLYPNPVAQQATLEWRAPAAGTGRWLLTNAAGQVVHAAPLPEQAGANQLTLDLRAYPPGSYVLTLESATGLRQHRSLLKAE